MCCEFLTFECLWVHVLYSVLSPAMCTGTCTLYCTVFYHHWLCVQVCTCTVQYVAITGCVSLAVCTGIYMYCTVCYYHWLCVQADDYMTVEAPAKKQRLLTEHQKEKRRERSDSIPTMYNALDPSQDASQLVQYTADPPLPDRYMYIMYMYMYMYNYIHINSATCTCTCAFYIHE